MSEVYAFISKMLAPVHTNSKDIASLEMVADEIFTNVMSYAYEESADKWVMLELSLEGEVVTMSFTDGGRPFDPLNVLKPDISLPVNEREMGGLGIYIVRSVMDDMRYVREGDRNILTTRKRIKKDT